MTPDVWHIQPLSAVPALRMSPNTLMAGRRRIPSALWGSAALAVAYVLTASLGFRLAFANESVTTVWPPTGVALAALVLWGRRLWPGVWVGAVAANLMNGAPVEVALGISVGNTLAPLLGAAILRRIGFSPSLGRPVDVFGLVFGAGFLSMLVSATGGTATLAAAGAVPPGELGLTFTTWWMGDAIGVVAIAPLMLVIVASRAAAFRRVPLELTCLIAAVGVGAWIIYTRSYPLRFLVLLFAVWAALRFQQAGAAIATFLLSGLAVGAAVTGHAFAPNFSITENLVLLQAFNGTIALTALTLAAVMGQRLRAQEAFRTAADALVDLNRGLEERIADRTAALSQSEAFHRLLSDNLSDVVIRVDLDRTIRYVSPSVRRLVGVDPEGLVGGELGAFSGHGDDPALAEAFRRASEEQEAAMWRGSVTTADGRRIWAEALFSPSVDPATGEVTEVIEVVRDITEHVRIRKSLEQAYDDLHRRSAIAANIAKAAREVGSAHDLRSAVGALSDAAKTLIEVEWITLAVREDSRKFSVVAHWGPEGWEFPEGMLIDVSSVDQWQWLREGRAEIIDDSTERSGAFEQMLRKRGVRSFIAAPMVAGAEVQAIVAFSSSRPNAFSREVLPSLEMLVREVSGPFNTLRLLARERQTADQLRLLNELKNDFVGIVAHDLKSPMAALKGYARLLQVHWTRSPDDQKQELVERIGEGLTRLTSMVDDVLQVAHIESGEIRYDIQPFDLGALISRTVEEMLAAAPGRICDVTLDDDLPPALGDTGQQWRVLTNLLSNAFKFSDDGVTVRVHAERQGSEILVEVADLGRGIDPEDMPRLFERFSRIQQPAGHKVAGTGLGLHICRSLVEGQGGRIWAESRQGVGTTFFYTVPVAGADVLRLEVDRLREEVSKASVSARRER